MLSPDGVHACHPLVVAEASETGRVAVATGIECARRSRGRLSVIYLAQPHHACLTAMSTGALIPPVAVVDELETGEQLLAAVRNEVPVDIPVCTKLVIARHGHCKQVLATAEMLLCDAIIVPMTRGLFGFRRGLGAELARRSKLPLSVIERTSGSTENSHVPLTAGSLILEAIA